MKRLLIGVGAALAILVIAVSLYLSFGDFSTYRPRIEAGLSEALGREVRIGGPLEIRPLPTPSFSVSGVSVENAAWGSDAHMLEIGQAAATVGLWSLLSGPVVVRDLRLEDVTLLLETNADGESNWATGGGAEADDAAPPEDHATGLPLLVESALVRNAMLVYRSAGADERRAVIESLEIRPDDAGGLRLEGGGEVSGLPLALEGNAGSIERLRSGGPVDVSLTGGLGDLRFELRGSGVGDGTGGATTLETRMSAPAIETLLQAFGIDPPVEGPFELEANLRDDDGAAALSGTASLAGVAASVETRTREGASDFRARVEPLDRLGEVLGIEGLPSQPLEAEGRLRVAGDAVRLEGVTAKVAAAEMNFDGTVAAGGRASDLAVRIAGPSLAELREGLPALPYDIGVSIDLSPELLEFASLTAQVGESDLSGSGSIALGRPLRVTAELASRQLDIAPLEAEPQPEGERAADDGDRGYVFTEEPLPLDALRSGNASVDLTVARLIGRTIELEDVSVELRLDDADLRVVQRFTDADGGRSAARLRLRTRADNAELTATVGSRGLRYNAMSGEEAEAQDIPPTDLTMRLSATGRSPRELASSLDGTILVTQGAGRVDNQFINTMSGDVLAELFSALNPFAKKERYSNWECTVLSMVFDDGTGEMGGFLLQSEKLMIVGHGKVDLNTERLNIEFNTKPREGVGITADMIVTPFVSLSGTLAEPGVGLNTRGILLSGGAAFATGGLSFLAEGLLDRATAEADHCGKALAEAGDHPSLDELLGGQ